MTTLTARIVRSEFNNSDISPGKHYSDDYSCLSNTYQNRIFELGHHPGHILWKTICILYSCIRLIISWFHSPNLWLNISYWPLFSLSPQQWNYRDSANVCRQPPQVDIIPLVILNHHIILLLILISLILLFLISLSFD